jgi:hypothetical protein
MSGRFLLRFSLLLSLATLTSNTSAQTSVLGSLANSRVEVLYLQQNSTILTYDVSPENAQGTMVGQPLSIPATPFSIQLITAPRDRFIYILGTDSQNLQHIWVYATDSLGVPQTPAVQDFDATAITQFQVAPNGRFAYAVETKTNPAGEYVSDLRLFTVNRNRGTLTESPTIQAKYPPNYYCGPSLDGFSPDGNQLYDIWFCSTHDSVGATYYYRSINPTTGSLSPRTQFFSWQDGTQGGDEVDIARDIFFDLHDPIPYQPSYNALNIYPLVPGPKKPLIHCTSKMLQACQDSGYMRNDPLGRFAFLSIPSGIYVIAKVDWETKQIVDTGNSLNNLLNLYFSPDERLLYGVGYADINSQSTVQFYGFNSNSGALAPGNLISLDALYNAFPAERW